MIPAKGYTAVFCVDPAKGIYVEVDVIAWDDDGGAQCADRCGYLVTAKDRPGFVRLLAPMPADERRAPDDHAAWFRKVVKLAKSAPLDTTADGRPTTPHPFVPDVETAP